MKTSKLIKKVSVFMAFCMLTVSCCSFVSATEDPNIQTSATPVNRTISYLDVTANGVKCDYSYYVQKTINGSSSGGYYRVQLDPYNNSNPGYNVVMNSEMQNSNYDNRGTGQTYQSTSNTIGNWGSSGYVYRLRCTRQYPTDDVYVRFTGTWSPDQW